MLSLCGKMFHGPGKVYHQARVHNSQTLCPGKFSNSPVTVFYQFLVVFLPFPRYSAFVDWSKENSSVSKLRIISFLNSLVWRQPRPAVFVAYFQPCSSTILYLMCCPAQLKQQVIQNLEDKGIKPCKGSSKKDMIPGHDKAFVFVSGGIRPFDENEMEDFYLK